MENNNSLYQIINPITGQPYFSSPTSKDEESKVTIVPKTKIKESPTKKDNYDIHSYRERREDSYMDAVIAYQTLGTYID